MNSLRTKILTLLLGSILVTSVLLSTAGIASSQKVVTENSAKIMKLICEERALKIDGMLLAVEQAVETDYQYICERVRRDETLAGDVDKWKQQMENAREVLENTARCTDFAVAVYFRMAPELSTYKSGIFLVREGDEFIEREPTDLSLYSPEDTGHVGWYYQPIANGGPTWLEAYLNKNIQVEMISYVIPIYLTDGQLLGVIGMDIDVQLLKDAVREQMAYKTGKAMLTNKNGDIVYHEDYPEGVLMSEYDAELRNVTTTLSRTANDSDGEVFSFKWHGEERQLTYKQLSNGMFLVITAASSEINASRHQLILQCAVISLILALLALMLGAGLVRRMTRPLLELTRVAEKVAEGEWDVEIQCESRDEVGVLAATLKHSLARQREYVNHISRLANTDALTGMYSRRYMNWFCQEKLVNRKVSVGVVYCDLNGLKHENDHHGHAAGDAMIIRFAEILQSCFPEDVCCRISGDEFVVFTMGKNAEEFLGLTEQLRKKNLWNGRPIASVGSCWKTEVGRMDPLLTEAEDAMYRDKARFYENYPEYRR